MNCHHKFSELKAYPMKEGILPSIIEMKACLTCGDEIYYFPKDSSCPVCQNKITSDRMCYATNDLPANILFCCRECAVKCLRKAVDEEFSKGV